MEGEYFRGEKTKTKKQHYVPIFYLQRFCNKRGKLCVYDKKKERFIYPYPKDFCFKNYLYEYEANDSRFSNGKHILQNDIENIYASEEKEYSSWFNTIIKRLDIQTNSSAHILRKNEYEIMLDLVNNFLVRNPALMKMFLSEEYYKEFVRITNENGSAELLDKLFHDAGFGSSEGFMRLAFKKSYLDTKNAENTGFTLKPYIETMSFVFLKSEEKCFLTSDFPVRMEIPENGDHYESLYMPISPKYAVNFFHNKTADKNMIRIIDEETANELNRWVFLDNYSRYIISNDKNRIIKAMKIRNKKHISQNDKLEV